MKYGMPFLLECGTVEENAAVCASLGLDFLELNLSFPTCGLDQLTAERLLNVQRQYGIGLTAHLHEELAPCAFEERVSAAWVSHARDAIVLARQAGITLVNMHWMRGVRVTLPDRVVYLSEAYRETYLEKVLSFRKVCAEASRGAVTVCVENLEEGWLPFQREAIELLLEDPTFQLTMDIGHAAVAKGKDEDFFRQHRDRLRHMHAHDAEGEHPHLPFGTGKIDLEARLSLAQQCGARALLEVKTLAALRETTAWLDAHGKR